MEGIIDIRQSGVGARGSRRGIDGGFVLIADSRKISLVDIIEAVDGPIALNVWLMSGERCDQHSWCGAHQVWIKAQAAMVKVLRSQSLAELAAQTASKKRACQAKQSLNIKDVALEEVSNV